ncbi:MAG: hypothetical protein HFI48_08575 [Lachnospiraceae bacterium]|nr:hypothetical protein [Lachnospiraceae bacterium]
MLLGLEWHWWIVLLVLLAVSIPFKIKFLKWWNRRRQETKKDRNEKWGDEQ